MARRSRSSRSSVDIGVTITGEADLDQARRDVTKDLDKIERAAKDTAEEIDNAFRKLSPELDTADIRRALDLAGQLDGMVANFTVDTDLSEIQEAEKLARSLRQFQGRVDLSVEGRAELKDALGLAEKMDQLRTVKVQVQGRADLEKAEQLVKGLDGKKIDVDLDVDTSDLSGLGDKFGDVGSAAGDAFSGGFDPNDVGSTIQEGVLGAVAAAGPVAAAAVGVGAIFADSFATGFSRGFAGTARSDLLMELRGDLTGAEMKAVGQAGAEAYNEGFGESLQGVKETAALIKGELGDIDDSLDLTEATRQAEALAEVFGVDLGEAVTSVDALVSQGLVRNTEEGFNLLFELGQKTGLQFEEMLELTNEFGTAVKALGIDGAQGMQMIADMVEQKIFPQVDQAGEVFEELNETIITGGAAEALDKIGLSAAGMQEAIAGGGPEAAAAVAEIAATILDLDSNAAQAEATTAIFGSNMGLLGDEAREAALQLFTAADATAEVGTGASDAADDIAAMQTEWDKFSKDVEEAGVTVGNAFATAMNRAKEFAESLPGIGESDQGLAELEESAVKAGQALERGGDGAAEFADGVDAAAEATQGLLSELQGLFNFAPDQLLRETAEAGASLAEALTADTAAVVGLNGAIDISTESGRSFQEEMESLNGTLVRNAEAAINGDITGRQFAAAQRQIEADLMAAAAAAGLTADQAEGLRRKYLELPQSVNTDIRATDLASRPVRDIDAAYGRLPATVNTTATFNAWSAIQNVNSYVASLLNIPTNRSTTVTQTTVRRTVNPDTRHSGGPVAAGTPYVVGGPGAEELFVPGSDGHVFNPSETRSMLSGGAPGAQVGLGGGGGPAVLEIRSGGSALDDLLVEVLRKAVQNRGGIDIVFGRR